MRIKLSLVRYNNNTEDSDLRHPDACSFQSRQDGAWTMYVLSIASYLVHIIIISLATEWISSYTYGNIFEGTNATLGKFNNNRRDISLLENEFQETGISGRSESTKSTLRNATAPKRTKRCLLTMMALGGMAGLTSMFFDDSFDDSSSAPRPSPRPVYVPAPPTPAPPPAHVPAPPAPSPPLVYVRPPVPASPPPAAVLPSTVPASPPPAAVLPSTVPAPPPPAAALPSPVPAPPPPVVALHPPAPAPLPPDPTVPFSPPPPPPPDPATSTTATLGLEDLTLIPESAVPDQPANLDETIQHPTNCETPWGTCVINGSPKYSLEDSTIIVRVVEKLVRNVWVLEFVHPVTSAVVRLPRDVGDEYVIPERNQVFIIFVDRQARTYLIRKPSVHPFGKRSDITDNPIADKTTCVITNINTNINTIVNYNKFFSSSIAKHLGWSVIDGVPAYDASRATFVMNVTKNIANGIWVIEFVHPLTGMKIQVPATIGDDYVVEPTHQIFKIFVDSQGRSCMVFSGSNINKQIRPGNKLGVPSIRGIPAYAISNAIIIEKTVQKVDNGILIIEFLHPVYREIIQVPFNIGDEHVELETQKVFLIFVDKEKRTLLIFKGVSRQDVTLLKSICGSTVTNGFPKYDLSNATIVKDTTQKFGVDGRAVIEFVHPFTGQIIQIDVDVGQTHVERETGNISVIFVDTVGRTLLIFKGLAENRFDIMQEYIVGHLVIKGTPKYDISQAIVVMETVQKLRADGTTVMEIVHPITRQKAQIPINVGDAYIDESTREVFVIFVDKNNRTLLIFNGWTDKKEEIAIKPGDVGNVVVNGVPSYDLATAIYVRDVVQKIGVEAIPVIEFLHPVTRQKIQLSIHVGEEYRKKETGEIFIIFVDVLDRTYLIFKGYDYQTTEAAAELLGLTIVYRGIPRYDVSTAIFLENSEQTLSTYGTIVISFAHPLTGKNIELPYYVGDTYVKPGTERVYKICIDNKGRTLMVYMHRTSRDNNHHWISVVKSGIPKYDISRAIIIMESDITIERDGIITTEYIEFEHPYSHLIIKLSTNEADTYSMPKTRNSFIICVDNRGRTLLIFRGSKASSGWHRSDGADQSSRDEHAYTDDYSMNNDNININTNINRNALGKPTDIRDQINTGSRIVYGRGNVPYDVSNAIYVTKSKKKMKVDGTRIIEFVHPETGKTINIPLVGGNDYIDRQTHRIYIIYVDAVGRTLLVFKGYPNDYIRAKEPTFGSIEFDDDHDYSNSQSNVNENNNINYDINENLVGLSVSDDIE